MDGNYLTSSNSSLLRDTGPHRLQQSGVSASQSSVRGIAYTIKPVGVVRPIRVSSPAQPAVPSQR